ncbi:MAG: SpoIIE family protein phosphatase [Candidatus Kryptoniota bacterium]
MSQKDKFKVNKALIELSSFIETATILTSSLDFKFILNHIMLASMGKLMVSKSLSVVRLASGKMVSIEKGIRIPADILNELFLRDIDRPVFVTASANRHFRELAKYMTSYIFPIRTASKLIGYLFLGKKMLAEELSDDEKEFVTALCNISAAAIENADVLEQYRLSNIELQRKIQELQTLFDLSKEFGLIVNEDRVVRTLEFAIMGQTGVRRYAICLNDPKGNGRARVVVNRMKGIEEIEFGDLCGIEKPIKLSEIVGDNELIKRLQNLGAEVLVPFRFQREHVGILILGERISMQGYSDAEIELISSICNLSAIAVENARLFQESLAKQRLEEELNLARTIQEHLFPRQLPQFNYCEISALNLPSKQVGGDYYDIMALRDNSLCAAIADVSGKGFPASLLMANLQSAFRALAEAGLPLSEITRRLNEIIYRNTDFDRFVTFFGVFYNPADGAISYVNAGHNYPYLIRNNGQVERLESGGIVLGVLSSAEYCQESLPIGCGDLLFMFTDGVSEALNESGQQYGEDQLEAVLLANKDRSAEEISQRVLESVVKFAGSAAQSDDITMVCIKFA